MVIALCIFCFICRFFSNRDFYKFILFFTFRTDRVVEFTASNLEGALYTSRRPSLS